MAGCLPWVLLLTFIGKQAGDNWDDWKDKLHYVDYVVIAVHRRRDRIPARPVPPRRRGAGPAATETT